MTYSSHAALSKQGIVYYFLTFSVHLLLFTLFAIEWFVPSLELPAAFAWLLLIAVVGQLLALLIPSTGGKMTFWHDITAYTMHFLLTPLVFMIALTSNLEAFTRALVLIIGVAMVGLLFMFLFVKKSKDYSLYLQTAYGLSFHIAILVATYLR